MIRTTFWGVRGSIPTPGPSTVGFGGNTSCVEVQCGATRIVFDSGTGIRLLGQKLLAEMPFDLHLFFSHVHWDHIQGFPFFAPAFIPGNTFHLYGGNDYTGTVDHVLAGQMENPNFPVHLSEMGAKMTFGGVRDGQMLEVGEDKVVVRCVRGNHPQGVWAYRIEHGGRSLVYATDTEHYSIVDPQLAKLAAGADVLVHDAQYTPDEYAGKAGTGGPKTGWGHSTYVAACEMAKAAGVKQLVLFHHDPGQTDAAVRDKEKKAQALFANSIAAHEGLTLEP
jgi:phosphoribosyl 1,2-cyclic phosphodiesterase